MSSTETAHDVTAESTEVAPESEGTWTTWRVADTSSFLVESIDGSVGLVQKDAERFLVTNAFKFVDPEIEADFVRRLARDMPEPQAQRAYADASSYSPRVENPTDMASIPRYMRWFENTYGRHTLAAIIHDDLIVEEPNGGALGSDTLADRFFRVMMRDAGVPWLKRWIMWAATATRSRWAAGGGRRISLLVWGALALVGIVAFVDAVLALLFDVWSPIEPLPLLVVSLVLPVVSSSLWGKQFGAGLIAAVAALWLLPAALVALLGYMVYRALEFVARPFDRR